VALSDEMFRMQCRHLVAQFAWTRKAKASVALVRVLVLLIIELRSHFRSSSQSFYTVLLLL
jgi:hypothetical protein